LVIEVAVYGLLFVAVLEVCARAEDWIRWGAPLVGTYSFDQLRFSDALGYRNRPHARYRHFTINSHGFRGPEISTAKQPGTIRVVLAGASEVFGLYESPGRDLAPQLQRLLDAQAPGRYEVVNAATAGLSPPRIRELYEAWIDQFDPDVFVFYPTPGFYLDDQPPGLARRVSPVGPPAGAARFSLGDLRLRDRTWNLLRETLPGWLQTQLKLVQIERERARHPAGWTWTRAPEERLELFRQHTDDLVSTVRRSGARVVLCTHATRFKPPLDRAETEQMIGWLRFAPRATAESSLEMDVRANAILRQLAAARDVRVADVAAAMNGRRELFADFAHFNDDGAAEAARVIAGAIRATVSHEPATP
jgi:hypothetical protein